MKKDRLTQAYLDKAKVRLEALSLHKEKKAFSDVVREAQELVERLLKAVLRALGVDFPKIHDVGRVLGYAAHLPRNFTDHLREIQRISKRLRKERELSFYGAEDFIPTEEYDAEDAEQAIQDAAFAGRFVSALLHSPSPDHLPNTD